jgi:hypothetical protein
MLYMMLKVINNTSISILDLLVFELTSIINHSHPVSPALYKLGDQD